jgi:hypothetical protein
LSGSSTLLSRILVDVASAVVSTQKELDKVANASPADLPLAPLALVVKHSEVILLGNLAVQKGSPLGAQDRPLTFALVNRVQAGLRGSNDASLSTRVSVSIEAIEPPHGS